MDVAPSTHVLIEDFDGERKDWGTGAQGQRADKRARREEVNFKVWKSRGVKIEKEK